MIYFLSSLYIERLFLKVKMRLPEAKCVISLNDECITPEDIIITDTNDADLIQIHQNYRARVIAFSETSNKREGIQYITPYSSYDYFLEQIAPELPKEIFLIGTADDLTLEQALNALKSILKVVIVFRLDFHPESTFRIFEIERETYFSERTLYDLAPLSHLMDALNPPENEILALFDAGLKNRIPCVYFTRSLKGKMDRLALERSKLVLCVHDRPKPEFDKALSLMKGTSLFSFSGIQDQDIFKRKLEHIFSKMNWRRGSTDV